MPRLDAVEPRSGSAHEVLEGVRAVLRALRAEVLVDLSDEPVVGYRERFLLMSAALAEGAAYVTSDTEVRPQAFARLAATPSLAVIGTGKRVGKTAVSGWLARRLDAARRADGGVVVLAMGRGGPPEPELIRGGDGLGPAELLAASRAGRHAASDCYEDAVLAGVTAVGCRRCGGGLAGMPFDDNVRGGAAPARRARRGAGGDRGQRRGGAAHRGGRDTVRRGSEPAGRLRRRLPRDVPPAAQRRSRADAVRAAVRGLR